MVVQHPSQYAAHVRQLAAAFSVDLIEEVGRPPDKAFAAQLVPTGPLADVLASIGLVALKGVVIAPVFDETTYAVALHELGHCLAPNGVRPEKAKLSPAEELFWQMALGEEEAAWAWAQHMALEWTGPMESVRVWALGTYAEGERLAKVARAEAAVEAARKQREQAAWDRRHRVEPVEQFLKTIRMFE